jgi:DNA-binding transcriptional ArsR family regulator
MATSTAEDEGSYADDAPLMALFGSPARTKLVSVFVAEQGRDLTVSEISRQADVSRTTVYDHLDELLELGVIKESRATNDGHSTLYQLNDDSDIAELCYQLEGITLRKLLENDGQM